MSRKLSSKEKRRLNRLMRNILKLANYSKELSPTYSFIMRQQIRAVLRLLGHENPNRVIVGDAAGVLKNPWPFKKYQLRKLIRNGRRA